MIIKEHRYLFDIFYLKAVNENEDWFCGKCLKCSSCGSTNVKQSSKVGINSLLCYFSYAVSL